MASIGFAGFAGCCLTIESEERETWTAGSLRGRIVLSWSDPGRGMRLMRDFWRSRFQVHRVCVSARECGQVCLGLCQERRAVRRRLEKARLWRAAPRSGCEQSGFAGDQPGKQILSIQLESLILAQNERWRQA